MTKEEFEKVIERAKISSYGRFQEKPTIQNEIVSKIFDDLFDAIR